MMKSRGVIWIQCIGAFLSGDFDIELHNTVQDHAHQIDIKEASGGLRRNFTKDSVVRLLLIGVLIKTGHLTCLQAIPVKSHSPKEKKRRN